jgi:hypothetical protein
MLQVRIREGYWAFHLLSGHLKRFVSHKAQADADAEATLEGSGPSFRQRICQGSVAIGVFKMKQYEVMCGRRGSA